MEKSNKSTVNENIWQWSIIIVLGTTIIISLYLYFAPKPDYRNKYDPKLISLESEIQSYKKQLGNTNNYVAYNRLANAYIRQARLTGDPSWYILAEKNAKSSLYHSPVSNYSALLSLSSINMAKHEFIEAQKNVKELLTDNSTKLDALGLVFDANYAIGNLSECQKALNEINKAKEEIFKLKKTKFSADDIPDTVNSSRKALLEYSKGNLKESEKYFIRAIKESSYLDAEPKAWVYTLYANFLKKTGRSEEAQQNIQFAINNVPEYISALFIRADIYSQEKKLKEENEILNQLNKKITRSDIILKLALSEKKLGNIDSYNTLINQSKKLLDEELSEGGFGHRRDYIKLLLTENTSQSLSLALEKAQAEKKLRKDLDTLNIVTETEIKNNEWQLANQTVNLALNTGVKDSTLYYLKGQLSENSKDKKMAIDFYKKAINLNPDFEYSEYINKFLVENK